jgi:hypothetical protein
MSGLGGEFNAPARVSFVSGGTWTTSVLFVIAPRIARFAAVFVVGGAGAATSGSAGAEIGAEAVVKQVRFLAGAWED